MVTQMAQSINTRHVRQAAVIAAAQRDVIRLAKAINDLHAKLVEIVGFDIDANTIQIDEQQLNPVPFVVIDDIIFQLERGDCIYANPKCIQCGKFRRHPEAIESLAELGDIIGHPCPYCGGGSDA